MRINNSTSRWYAGNSLLKNAQMSKGINKQDEKEDKNRVGVLQDTLSAAGAQKQKADRTIVQASTRAMAQQKTSKSTATPAMQQTAAKSRIGLNADKESRTVGVLSQKDKNTKANAITVGNNSEETKKPGISLRTMARVSGELNKYGPDRKSTATSVLSRKDDDSKTVGALSRKDDDSTTVGALSRKDDDSKTVGTLSRKDDDSEKTSIAARKDDEDSKKSPMSLTTLAKMSGTLQRSREAQIGII